MLKPGLNKWWWNIFGFKRSKRKNTRNDRFHPCTKQWNTLHFNWLIYSLCKKINKNNLLVRNKITFVSYRSMYRKSFFFNCLLSLGYKVPYPWFDWLNLNVNHEFWISNLLFRFFMRVSVTVALPFTWTKSFYINIIIIYS